MTDIPPDYCKCYVNILHHTFETFMPLPSYFWDFDAPIRHTFGTLVPLPSYFEDIDAPASLLESRAYIL